MDGIRIYCLFGALACPWAPTFAETSYDVADFAALQPGQTCSYAGTGVLVLDGVPIGSLEATASISMSEGEMLHGSSTVQVQLTEVLAYVTSQGTGSASSTATMWLSYDAEALWLHQYRLEFDGVADPVVALPTPRQLLPRLMAAGVATAYLLDESAPSSEMTMVGPSVTVIEAGSFDTLEASLSTDPSAPQGAIHTTYTLPGFGDLAMEVLQWHEEAGQRLEAIYSLKLIEATFPPVQSLPVVHPWSDGTLLSEGWLHEGPLAFNSLDYPYVGIFQSGWWFTTDIENDFRFIWRPDRGWMALSPLTYPYAYAMFAQAWVDLRYLP